MDPIGLIILGTPFEVVSVPFGAQQALLLKWTFFKGIPLETPRLPMGAPSPGPLLNKTLW